MRSLVSRRNSPTKMENHTPFENQFLHKDRVSEHGTLRSHEARMAHHEVSSIRLTNSKTCADPEITYHNTMEVTPKVEHEQN